MKNVKTIQLRTLDDHVAIMFSSASIAARFVDENKSQCFTTSDGLVSPMPCWIDEECTTVRVHDLPPEMPHRDIWTDMEKYGKVTQIYHEYWRTLFKGVKNGVRIIKMIPNKPIPSYIIIGGYRTGCTYEGQIATCRHCNQPIHSGNSCATAANLLSPLSETTLEPMHKKDTQKTGSGSNTQQPKPAKAQTNSSSSSLSSSPLSSPRQTKQRSAVETPAIGSGFSAVLQQLSSKAAYPDLPPPPLLRAEVSGPSKQIQIKRQHSIQIDEDQKRTRAVQNSSGSPGDTDVVE